MEIICNPCLTSGRRMFSFLFDSEESEAQSRTDSELLDSNAGWSGSEATPGCLPPDWVPGSKGREGGACRRKWRYLDSLSGKGRDVLAQILCPFPNSPSLLTTASETPMKIQISPTYNNHSYLPYVCRGHENSHLVFSAFPRSVLSQPCIIGNIFSHCTCEEGGGLPQLDRSRDSSPSILLLRASACGGQHG